MKRVVVGSRKSANKFESSELYAVISFVGWWSGSYDTPPRIKRPPSMLGRIIIRCDDCPPPRVEEFLRSHHMSRQQAKRVAAFVQKMAPQIDTLFVHCEQGIGRSPGVGKAICDFYGVPLENVGEYASESRGSNDFVQLLVAVALIELAQSYAGIAQGVYGSPEIVRRYFENERQEWE